MEEKPHTKTRISKINQLPEDIKTQLNILLREKQMTQSDIRLQINALIDEFGLPDNLQISRNGLSRYTLSFHKGMERYQQAQEMTKQWVAKFGETPQTDIARSLIEIGKSQIFEVQMNALEEGKTLSPKVIGQIALSIKRLQEAQSGSVKLEKEIRNQAIEDSASTAEKTAKSLGLTTEGAKTIRDQILGLSS